MNQVMLAVFAVMILIHAVILLILTKRWVKDRNPERSVIISFLLISITILSLTALGLDNGLHEHLGLLGSTSALIALTGMLYPKTKKWITSTYLGIALIWLLIPYCLAVRIITTIIALTSIAMSTNAYIKTRHPGMAYFTMGIILFTFTGLAGIFLPYESHFLIGIGVIVGLIFWIIPFI